MVLSLGIRRDVERSATHGWATLIFDVRKTDTESHRPEPVESSVGISVTLTDKTADHSITRGRIN